MDIVAVLDEVTSPDTYTGHGHAFEENLVACIQFAVPVSLRESVGEIIEGAIEDINSGDFLVFFTDDEEKQERIRELLTDERIREALWANIPEGVKEDDPFFIEAYGPTENIYQYGYIHVYEEVE